MTTRLQILRSSTPGQTPAAGTRQPGELWTTFPDLQLGVIDASRNAQKLVAVRYFATTANYAVGEFVVQAGALYVAKTAVAAGAFNAGQWTYIGSSTDPNGPFLPLAGGTLTGPLVLAADPGAALGAATKQYVDGKVTAAPFLPLAGGTLTGLLTLSGPPTVPLHAATKAYVDSGAFVPIAGGTMTGPLTLAANPAAPLQSATKQYVDALPAAMNDNRLINGDMRIDQRNNGASGTVNGYTVDRWQCQATQANKGSWQRVTSVPVAGFPYALYFVSASAYALTATDYFMFLQSIEADLISDFQWGTAQAQPVTLSFWVNASVPGTFGGSLRNASANRSYPFSYSLPSANVWTKIVVTIPGDTAGTWALSGNAAGGQLALPFGIGASLAGPANAWASSNYLGPTGTASIVGANGAQILFTGVKLEIGSVATPYNRQSLTKSLADCQRYYQVGSFKLDLYAAAGQATGSYQSFPVTMRAAPTVTPTFTTQTNGSSGGALPQGANGTEIYSTAAATGTVSLTGTFTASAEL